MKFDTININQIYHTSHCGSTLMAALLSNSSIVYSEPPWTKNLLLNEDLDFNLLKDLYNIVIKFGSGWCKYSNIVPGKKIFLYRKLKHHIGGETISVNFKMVLEIFKLALLLSPEEADFSQQNSGGSLWSSSTSPVSSWMRQC